MRHGEFSVMLKCSPLLGDLDATIIDTLARLCTVRTLKTGATLFQRGDAGDCLYGVRRGQMAIELTAVGGQRITLASLGSGDLFGEIALLDGKGRTADAIAVESSELFALERASVLALIAQEPTVGIKLIEVLCRRLRMMSAQIEQNLTKKLDARIAGKLLQLAEDFGEDIAITQEQLARAVNATRESVNRQLRLWDQAGVLEVRRGGISLKDLSALKLT